MILMILIPGYILQVASGVVGDMMMISQFYNREGRALDKLSFSSTLLNCFMALEKQERPNTSHSCMLFLLFNGKSHEVQLHFSIA